jgi:hypothetical protein
MLTAKWTSIRIAGTGVLVLGIGACTSAVVVQSDFPAPLVEPLPVAVGLFYEPKLRNFIHAEALPRSSTWTIDLGDANLAMLDPIYRSMFSRTQEFSDLPPSPTEAASVDAVLTSTLEQFQFDVPRSSRDEFVEVWLQYRLQLLDDGVLIVEWLVPGYGKAEIDGNREEAVQRAAIVAMREAGALISTEFSQQPDVKSWLEEREDAS